MKFFNLIVPSIFGLLLSTSASAVSFDDLLLEVENNSISLESIFMLKEAEELSEGIGYGLCMAADRNSCISSGSIGYGLCMAADRNSCTSSGSIGYGLCMMADRNSCISSGSIGYGLCMVAGRNSCISSARD